MPLTHRDKRALIVLAIVLPVILLFFYGDQILSALRADSSEYVESRARFNPLYQKLKNHERLSREIAAAQKRLHVKVSPVSADQQKDDFLKIIEDEGLKRQIQITGHRWLTVTRSTKSPGVEKRAFQIDCTGQFSNLIEFVKGIEGLTVPVVIDEISLSRRQASAGGPAAGKASGGNPGRGGRGGGGGGQGNEAQLKTTLQLHLYMFPEGGGEDATKS